MADISTFVDVNISIEAGAVPRLAFGRGLLVTTNSRMSAGGSGKVRLFDSAADVAEALGGDSEAAAAAAVWFAADPAAQGLYVGRWAHADVDTSLTGARVTAAPDSGALDVADCSFSLDGVDITGVNLSAADTYAAIAAALAVAINAESEFSGVTVTYSADTGAFTLTLADESPIAGGALGSVGSGTDISAALGMDAASDPLYVQGAGAETIAEGVAAMMDAAVGARPVYVMLDDSVELSVSGADTRNALAAAASASDYVYALLDTADAALVTGDITSHGALAFSRQQGGVAAVYGLPGAKPDVGLMGIMSSQNFDRPAAVLSAHGKTMPGVRPADLTGAQIAELERKRMNTYALVGDSPRTLGSYTSRDGYWLDAVAWLMWLRSAIEARVWTTLTGSRRYTTALLRDDLIRVLEQGVRNGGIRPGGTVSAATKAAIVGAGYPDFDGTLSTGYLIHIDPLSAANRASRVADFTVWVVGTEAIHRVFGDLRFTN